MAEGDLGKMTACMVSAEAVECHLGVDGIRLIPWDHPPGEGIYSRLPQLPTRASEIGEQIARGPAAVFVDGFFATENWTSWMISRSLDPEFCHLLGHFGRDQLLVAGDFMTSWGEERNKVQSLVASGISVIGLAGMGFLLGVSMRKYLSRGVPRRFGRRDFLVYSAIGVSSLGLAVGAGHVIQNRWENRLAEAIAGCDDAHFTVWARELFEGDSGDTRARTTMGIGKMKSIPDEEFLGRGVVVPERICVWGSDHLLPRERRVLEAASPVDYARKARGVYEAEAAYLVASDTPREEAIDRLVNLQLNMATSVFYRVVSREEGVYFVLARDETGKPYYEHPDILPVGYESPLLRKLHLRTQARRTLGKFENFV